MSGRRGFFSSKRVKNLFGLGKGNAEHGGGGGSSSSSPGGRRAHEEVVEFRKFELPKVNVEVGAEVRGIRLSPATSTQLDSHPPLQADAEQLSPVLPSPEQKVSDSILFRRDSDPFASSAEREDDTDTFTFNANSGNTSFDTPTKQTTRFDNSKFRQYNSPSPQQPPQQLRMPAGSQSASSFSPHVPQERAQMQQSASTYSMSPSQPHQQYHQQQNGSPQWQGSPAVASSPQWQGSSPAIGGSASQGSLHESILDDMDEHLMNELLSEG